MKTGIITGESIGDYHATDAFSASKLATFRKLPALYKAMFIDKVIPPKPPTTALDIGNALDCLLLEGTEEFHKRIVIHPEHYGPQSKDWSWNANECKRWGEMHEGKTILSSDEASLVEEMAQTALRHKDAAALLEHGRPAVTFRHDYGFAHGQCRPDWYNPEGTILPSTGKPTGPYWVELKSAASLHKSDYFTFKDAWVDKEYFLQLPLYREVMVDVLSTYSATNGNFIETNGAPRPFFIVVDKGEIPYAQVFDPLATDRGRYHFDLARRKILKDVEDLARCYETGIWPGLPDEIQSLELPGWKEKQLEREITE